MNELHYPAKAYLRTLHRQMPLPDRQPVSIRKLPYRGTVFLVLFFAVALVVTTSLAIYGTHRRLGYSYAVHGAIFYPFSEGHQYPFVLSLALTAALTYFVYRCLMRRHLQGVKLVPWLIQIALVVGLAFYVIEVLQIDIRWAQSEEYAKGSRPE